MPGFAHERRFDGVVAGIDEVGRGPLAGPVVAACVFLDPLRTTRKLRQAIDDSKKLSREERATASVTEIDRINILQASLLAMRRALARLPVKPDHVLIDGDRIPTGLPCAA